MIKLTYDLSNTLATFAKINTTLLAQVIGVAIAEDGLARMAVYPAPRPQAQPFKSDKQRRYFFWALKTGEITVPYQRGGNRSQTLGRRWMVEPTGNGAILYNSTSYAHLVHDSKRQAKYHRGNWKTDEGLVEEMEQDGTLEAIADQAVRFAISKAESEA